MNFTRISVGILKSYGSATALSNEANDILTVGDENNITILVLLDCSKAFVLINYEILLSKLDYNVFATWKVKLFTSYLIN